MIRLAIAAWAGSIFLILGALYFQFFQNLDPCVLCLYQRIPHYIAILLGPIAIWVWPRLRMLMPLVLLAAIGVAAFHVGVEFGWWPGLSSCSGDLGSSLDELFEQQPARCDEITWQFAGVSMAGWNAIISLALAIAWLVSSMPSRK